MTSKDIKNLFLDNQYPWIVEIKDSKINNNNIFIFHDVNINKVYMVWHMIDQPGHWKVVSNKGDNLILPEQMDYIK